MSLVTEHEAVWLENAIYQALARRNPPIVGEAAMELVRRIHENPLVADRLAELLATQTTTTFVDGATWTVLPAMTVTRTPGVFERLAAGCHDVGCRNSDANAEHFPIPEDGVTEEFESVLVHFGKDMTDEAVLAYAVKHELEDPRPEHTLTVGNKMSHLQKEYPIVATAHEGSPSVWALAGGNRCVLVLDSYGGLRRLNVSFCVSGWSGHCRFLFLRKKKQA